MLDSLLSLVRRLLHPDWRLFTALIELALIAFVVHAVLRFLRGSRGERLFRGVAVILLAATLLFSTLAERLELERIKVLYPPFLIGMLLVALVAFQPELRRALIRLGATRWFGKLAGDLDRGIDAVVQTAEQCARQRIGLLIAFERATQIAQIIESGTRLDAEISVPLLATIFWPGSALHDMGVVISAGRVAAAGCQFPLTESDELDPSFGSRHRAALGLAEESDAVIVVVSEETGTISIFEGGQVRRPLTPDALRDLLRSLLGDSAAHLQSDAPAHRAPRAVEKV